MRYSSRLLTLVTSSLTISSPDTLYDLSLSLVFTSDISIREASHIDFVHEKRHMDVRGWEFVNDISRRKIVENFDCLMKIFSILESSIQSIQNPAFS